jgi:hypothetical protein
MEWLVGIYLVIGVFKTLGRLANPNPALKPIWMSAERNPLKLALFFTLHSVLWPFSK